MSSQDLKKILIDVDDDLHAKLKHKAIDEDTTMKDLITTVLRQYVEEK